MNIEYFDSKFKITSPKLTILYILKTIYKGSLYKIIHFMKWLIPYGLNNFLNFNLTTNSCFYLSIFIWEKHLSHRVLLWLWLTLSFKSPVPNFKHIEKTSLLLCLILETQIISLHQIIEKKKLVCFPSCC